MAETTPGVAVARAHAAIGYHPCFPCQPVAGATTVFVVPRVPRELSEIETENFVRAPQTDPGALAAVAARLDARRLVTSEVAVQSAEYRAVRLQLYFQGVVTDETILRTTLFAYLTAYLDPLIGGEDGAGWPFGGPLRPSNLIKRVQSQIHAGILVRRVGIALDASPDFSDCVDVFIRAHELVYLQEMQLFVDQTPTAQGGLR
ncbi:MAG: hypothetical protein R3C53_06875 [Pirellulaceae bacterium]